MRVKPPKAVLFDVGGTLDGDGIHWLDRFLALYHSLNVPRSAEAITQAFYWAEDQLLRHPEITQMRWEPMLQRHVQYQLEHLGLKGVGGGMKGVARRLTEGFIQPTADLLRQHRELLAGLRPRLRLGVVSNFYGNLSVICDEFGLAPLLEVVVDSAVEKLYKPDPQIFTYALAQLHLPADEVWHVGDSWERDMVPAKQVGLQTVWLTHNVAHRPEGMDAADFSIHSLQELPPLLVGT
ncbi:MAG: HAD family hydrolase [Elusimicrobia bacterium]|nr:HAD family hydrolase [Elusimicrobiota bacterium]